MSLLSQVQSGKRLAPRRVLLYGTHGIGKSTFGATSDRPVFVQTEDGLGEIDCDKFPLALSYPDASRPWRLSTRSSTPTARSSSIRSTGWSGSSGPRSAASARSRTSRTSATARATSSP